MLKVLQIRKDVKPLATYLLGNLSGHVLSLTTYSNEFNDILL